MVCASRIATWGTWEYFTFGGLSGNYLQPDGQRAHSTCIVGPSETANRSSQMYGGESEDRSRPAEASLAEAHECSIVVKPPECHPTLCLLLLYDTWLLLKCFYNNHCHYTLPHEKFEDNKQFHTHDQREPSIPISYCSAMHGNSQGCSINHSAE